MMFLTPRRWSWTSPGVASGPLLVTRSGERLDRWAAWKVIRGLARTAGVEHAVFPTPCGTASSPARSTPESSSTACSTPPATATRERPAATTAPAAPFHNHAAYVVATYFG